MPVLISHLREVWDQGHLPCQPTCWASELWYYSCFLIPPKMKLLWPPSHLTVLFPAQPQEVLVPKGWDQQPHPRWAKANGKCRTICSEWAEVTHRPAQAAPSDPSSHSLPSPQYYLGTHRLGATCWMQPTLSCLQWLSHMPAAVFWHFYVDVEFLHASFTWTCVRISYGILLHAF
jgi:hypothetical protein